MPRWAESAGRERPEGWDPTKQLQQLSADPRWPGHSGANEFAQSHGICAPETCWAHRNRSIAAVVVMDVIHRGVVALVLAAALSGCAAADEEWFHAKLLNDTGTKIVIRENCISGTECHNHVSAYPIPGGDLAPGASVVILTIANGGEQPLVILNGSGQVLGCLPMKFDRPQDGVVIKVSAMIIHCNQL